MNRLLLFAASAGQKLQRYRLVLIFGFIYLLLSGFVMTHSVVNSIRFGDGFVRLDYDAMLKGTAWRPFAYRILIPRMTTFVRDLTPMTTRQQVSDSFMESLEANDFMRRYLPQFKDAFEGATFEKMVTTALNYGFLLGFIWMMFLLGRELFPEDHAIKWFAPIFGMWLVPSFSWQWTYIYDIPLLCLSAACFYCILKQKFYTLIILFTLATLNRESSIFILCFAMIWLFRRLPLSHYLSLSLLLATIYALIKITLYHAYANNIGWILEDNISRILSQDIFSKSGYFRMVIVAIIFFLLTYRWMEKPLFLKRALWLWPLVWLAYMRAGWPGEYRVFFDIMPLMVLLLTHTLIAGTGISQSSVFRKDGKPEKS